MRAKYKVFPKLGIKMGCRESQKEMSQNKKNGHSIAWYADGSLMMIEEYEQDKLMLAESIIQRASVFSISTVTDGKGLVTLFDGDGNFISKIEYTHSKPQLEDGQ